MFKILITGGEGLVGRHLSKRLKDKGYEVAILSRTRSSDAAGKYYTWNPDRKEIDNEAIDMADCIVHLAGSNIGDKRWTVKRKQLIVDSRIDSGELILSKIKERNRKPEVFISASAIGYYGTKTSNEIYTETDNPANDFLADTCKKWEYAADKFNEIGIRTVKIRSGVVLTERGGALAKMGTPVKMGIGSAIGTGRQYLPWIHIDDLCGIYIMALEDKLMNGIYNAVAPDHRTNKEFIKTLARVLKRPFWFPNVPAFVLRLLFGEMSDIVLEGSRVSSEKVESAGYKFLFPELENALSDLLE